MSFYLLCYCSHVIYHYNMCLFIKMGFCLQEIDEEQILICKYNTMVVMDLKLKSCFQFNLGKVYGPKSSIFIKKNLFKKCENGFTSMFAQSTVNCPFHSGFDSAALEQHIIRALLIVSSIAASTIPYSYLQDSLKYRTIDNSYRI